MNDVAKVIRLQIVATVPRQRPAARNWAGPAGQLGDLADRPSRPAEPPARRSMAESVRDAVGKQIGRTAEFARRRLTGDYQVDEFGFDQHLLESVLLPALRPLVGQLVPRRGQRDREHPRGRWRADRRQPRRHRAARRADASARGARHHPKQRALRLLAADLVFEMPMLGTLARKAGHTLACRPDAERLLRDGRTHRCVPGGIQGRRQTVRGPLQAAALRSRRVRVRRGAGRSADHPVLDRRLRGDLPEARPISSRWPGCSACRTSR